MFTLSPAQSKLRGALALFCIYREQHLLGIQMTQAHVTCEHVLGFFFFQIFISLSGL